VQEQYLSGSKSKNILDLQVFFSGSGGSLEHPQHSVAPPLPPPTEIFRISCMKELVIITQHQTSYFVSLLFNLNTLFWFFL